MKARSFWWKMQCLMICTYSSISRSSFWCTVFDYLGVMLENLRFPMALIGPWDNCPVVGTAHKSWRWKESSSLIKTQRYFVINLICKCSFLVFLGLHDQVVSQDHYMTGYMECLQQINHATNQCRMDVHLKSRLLQHLSRNQNVRMAPYTRRSSQDNYVNAPVSPLHIHPTLCKTSPSSPSSSRSPSTSPVHTTYPQLYINTNSPPQDFSGSNAQSSELAHNGLLRRSPCMQVPVNPPHQPPTNRAVQVVDKNNNVMNPVVPGPVSSPMWRPW